MKLALFAVLALAAAPARAQSDAPALTGTTWVEVAWMDPWTGETVRTDAASGAAAHTLTLAPDGRFVEDYEGGCCRREGVWQLEDDRLRLEYEGDASPVTFRVAKAEPDVLQLGARGREGEVIHTFAPRR